MKEPEPIDRRCDNSIQYEQPGPALADARRRIMRALKLPSTSRLNDAYKRDGLGRIVPNPSPAQQWPPADDRRTCRRCGTCGQPTGGHMFGGNCWRCATDPPTPVFNRMRPKMPPPGAFIIRPAQRRYYRPDQIAHEVIPGRGARVEYIPAQSPLSPHRPPRTRTCRNCARMIGGDGRPGDRFDATYPAYYVEAGKCEDCRAAAALARAESADAILAIDDLLPNEVGLLDEVATRNAREQTTELPSAEQCPNGPRRRRIKRLKRDLPASAADKLATKGLPLGAVVPYPLLLPDDGETIRSEVATCRRVTAIGLEWTPPHPEDRAMSRRASRQNEPTKPVGSKRLRPVNDPMRFSREGKGGRASVVSHLLQ